MGWKVLCDKCKAEIRVMIDIITKYPHISPHAEHAISDIENRKYQIIKWNIHYDPSINQWYGESRGL